MAGQMAVFRLLFPAVLRVILIYGLEQDAVVQHLRTLHLKLQELIQLQLLMRMVAQQRVHLQYHSLPQLVLQVQSLM